MNTLYSVHGHPNPHRSWLLVNAAAHIGQKKLETVLQMSKAGDVISSDRTYATPNRIVSIDYIVFPETYVQRWPVDF